MGSISVLQKHWARLSLRIIASLVVLLSIPAWAQTSAPKILVLTSHEGSPDSTPANSAGQYITNGLARAFGYTGTNIGPGPTTNAYLRSTPQVTYLYGALSIRLNLSTDTLHPNSPLPPAGATQYKVRVIKSGTTPTATEQVWYMPGNMPMLDPNDLSLFKPDNAERYDLVVVGTTYYKAVDEAYTTLTNLMKDPARKPGAILFFVDSCCDANNQISSNMARFISDVLKPATGIQNLKTGTSTTAEVVNLLNSGGPYSYSFKDKNPSTPNLESLVGYFFSWLSGVPDANQLFGQKSTPAGPEVYGAFFPTADIFKGSPNGGTCTFAVVDNSPFDSTRYAKNTQSKNPITGAITGTRNIGQAFIDAATAGGACGGMASITASPDEQAVTLVAPTPQPIVLTITNETVNPASNGDGSIAAGTVKATLPNHLKFAAGSTPTSTCNNGKNTTTLPVTVTPGTAPAGDGFEISGIGVAFKGSCTVSLPVTWSDTTDPATNACIKTASSKAQLTITPGAAAPANTFSTAQGQMVDLAQSAVVCTSPELELTQTDFPTGPLVAGSTVSYTVTVSNLSETAAANNAVVNDLVPAGAINPQVTPVGCLSSGDCSLAAKPTAGAAPSATFTVSFTVPSGQSQLSFTPNVALPAPQGEVTLVNNQLALTAAITKQVTVRAVLNGGNGQFAAQNLTYSLSGCSAVPTPSTTALSFDNSAGGTSHTVPAGETCTLGFSAVPGPTPTAGGYTLASPTPVLSPPTTDPLTGNQVLEAIWTAVAPGVATVKGAIANAPTPLPAGLAGQTVNYTMSCAPGAALPSASGVLTVDANGQLTSPDKQVPAGSSCTLALTSSLTPPTGYRVEAPTQSNTGNNFVVEIKVAPTLTVTTRINTPAGSTEDFSALLQALPYTVNACQATPANGSAPPKLNANGEAQVHTFVDGILCELDFGAGPNAALLPAGYTLSSSTPAITKSARAKAVSSGPQTATATWTVLAPGQATASGSVTGAPATFPTDLVGKTVKFALTCTPSAAIPAAGTLTIDNQGKLTSADRLMVATGSTCTLALTDDPSTLPLPAGYEWEAPTISSSADNSFVVTLPMKAKAAASAPTPVPGLQQWALIALALLMLAAAGLHLRRQR